MVKHTGGGWGVDAGALLWNKGGKREAEGKTVRGMQFCLVWLWTPVGQSLGGIGRQATEQMIYQDNKQTSDQVQEKRGQCKLEEGRQIVPQVHRAKGHDQEDRPWGFITGDKGSGTWVKVCRKRSQCRHCLLLPDSSPGLEEELEFSRRMGDLAKVGQLPGAEVLSLALLAQLSHHLPCYLSRMPEHNSPWDKPMIT